MSAFAAVVESMDSSHHACCGLVASGRLVHVGYTEGIQSKSRMVCSIIENEHGLMS